MAQYFGGESAEVNNGTLFYMAPELLQLDEQNDFKVDIWAAGVMVYYMYTGMNKHPFDSEAEEGESYYEDIKRKIRDEEPDYDELSNAPAEAIAFIKRCLVKDPN